jgi:uncharacterized protein with GYD domain
MSTYILLGTLTDEGADKLRTHPGWIEEFRGDLEDMGVHVTAQYAVLGPYDIVTLVEAPDNKSVVRVSAQLTMRSSIRIITLPALSIDEFITTLT